MGELEPFRFDRIEAAREALEASDLVVTHRNANGDVYAFHSPLEDGPVRCEWCETPGNRVYLEA